MRTTLTLEPDVARRIEDLRRTRGDGLKPLVNEILRCGLDTLDRAPARKPFVQPTLSVGEIRNSNLDDIAEVLALIEGEAHR